MKIQIVSDLHLEFEDVYIKNENDADVLILSGDICVAIDLHDHKKDWHSEELPSTGRRQAAAQRYRDFFRRVSFQFPQVIYVMGNHEHYHGKYDLTAEYLRQSFASIGITNIHLLDRETITIDDVMFIGGTLWTDMNKGDALTKYHLESAMNDFRVVRIAKDNFKKFLPSAAEADHHRMVKYIRTVTENISDDTKVVVVGHHAPSTLSIHERYKHDTLMNGGYASDLSELMLDRPQIKLWTHGHMHQSFDYQIGETRIVCNPKGYGSENDDFNPNFIVEI